jgi:hypothetical protein
MAAVVSFWRGRLHFRLFRILGVWLEGLTFNEKLIWPQVLWGLAKIAGPMPVAIGFFFLFCGGEPNTPSWTGWVLFGLLASSYLESRGMKLMVPTEVAFKIRDLLKKDPRCWATAAAIVGP